MSTMSSLPFSMQTVLLLMASNIFMLDYFWAALCMVGAVYFIFYNA